MARRPENLQKLLLPTSLVLLFLIACQNVEGESGTATPVPSEVVATESQGESESGFTSSATPSPTVTATERSTTAPTVEVPTATPDVLAGLPELPEGVFFAVDSLRVGGQPVVTEVRTGILIEIVNAERGAIRVQFADGSIQNVAVDRYGYYIPLIGGEFLPYDSTRTLSETFQGGSIVFPDLGVSIDVGEPITYFHQVSAGDPSLQTLIDNNEAVGYERTHHVVGYFSPEEVNE